MERSEKRVGLMEAELEWEEAACSHFIPIGVYDTFSYVYIYVRANCVFMSQVVLLSGCHLSEIQTPPRRCRLSVAE